MHINTALSLTQGVYLVFATLVLISHLILIHSSINASLYTVHGLAFMVLILIAYGLVMVFSVSPRVGDLELNNKCLKPP